MAEWVSNTNRTGVKPKRGSTRKSPLFVRAPFDPARVERLIALGIDAAAGVLLSNCAPIQGAAPFAIAWMAARLLWDRFPIGTILGVMIGLLIRWEPITLVNGWQLAACSLLFLGRGIQPRIALPAPWAMSILAGFFALLPMPFLWRSQTELLGCIGGAVISAMMTPVFDRLCASVRQRAYLELDDRLCCLLATAVIIFGGTAYTIGNFSAGGVLAVYCALSVAWAADTGAAIVAGLTLGAALALGGLSPFAIITIPMIVLVASLLKGTRKIWACAGALLANALVTLCLTAGTETIFSLAHIIIGAALYIITPESTLQIVREALERETITQTAPNGIAIQWMQTSANALASMAQAIPRPDMEEGGEIEQLATLLCESCNRKSLCWDERFEDTTLSLGDLLQASREETMKAEELSRLAHMNGCQRADLVPDALRSVNRASNRLDAWETAQMQASRLAKAQLRGQASLLGALSSMLAQASAAPPNEKMTISRALSKTRWRVCTAMPYRLDGLLQIVLIPPEGTPELGEPPVLALRRALAMELSVEPLWDGLVYISQNPPLYADIGVATRPAEGQTDNGDGWRSTRLPRGRHLLALSDGMGHGSDAAGESRTVLQLLEDGFHAGYGRHELLGVVNDLMRSCHGAERYATVDLCVLDLKSGEAAFEKMGACASFLIRQEMAAELKEGGLKCRKLSGGTLPMGILEDVTPKSFRMRLSPGDLLVMVSDGIVDAFEQEDAMLQTMASLAQEPQSFSDGLLRAALQRMGGEAKDDMTVLAACVKRVEFTE
ncbi:MAG: SpoIIE family protein phosphatase [Oscillospiraceae bacterium]|nr:SpoIIE family protein phosphatase [Oscillospiraceae bacterium]